MEGRIRQLEHMLENAEIVDDQFVYTILYEGDSPDQAERYVVGHLEEQVEGADVSARRAHSAAPCKVPAKANRSRTRRPTGRSR